MQSEFLNKTLTIVLRLNLHLPDLYAQNFKNKKHFVKKFDRLNGVYVVNQLHENSK